MSLKKDLREGLITEILELQNEKKYIFNQFLKPYTRNQLCDMEIEQLKVERDNIKMKE